MIIEKSIPAADGRAAEDGFSRAIRRFNSGSVTKSSLTPPCYGDVVHYNTVFLLNPNSGVPLYLQLQQQIQQRILSGQLSHGVQLPSARELSAELRINPLTVTKVYQNLERSGFVETRRGLGTYVAHQSPALKMEARRRQIGPAVEQLVVEALHLGLGEKEILSLVSEKFQQFKPRTGGRTHDD